MREQRTNSRDSEFLLPIPGNDNVTICDDIHIHYMTATCYRIIHCLILTVMSQLIIGLGKNLWWRKRSGIIKVIRIHPLGNINVPAKFCGNPSSSCEKNSVWNKVLKNQAD